MVKKQIVTRVDTELWKQLKIEAARQERTVQSLVETALRNYFAQLKEQPTK